MARPLWTAGKLIVPFISRLHLQTVVLVQEDYIEMFIKKYIKGTPYQFALRAYELALHALEGPGWTNLFIEWPGYGNCEENTWRTIVDLISAEKENIHGYKGFIPKEGSIKATQISNGETELCLEVEDQNWEAIKPVWERICSEFSDSIRDNKNKSNPQITIPIKPEKVEEGGTREELFEYYYKIKHSKVRDKNGNLIYYPQKILAADICQSYEWTKRLYGNWRKSNNLD